MNWPDLPDIARDDPQADVKKILLQGRVDVCKLERQHELDAEKAARLAEAGEQTAFWAHEYTLQQAVQAAYLEVAKGQIDRANGSAEFVQKAASAIATVYTSVVALSFIVNPTLKAPLPARGIAPAMFLGLSIALATGFRAYVTRPEAVPESLNQVLLPDLQRARRNTFIEWVRSAPIARQYWLQAAVVSLGIGVLLLPLPYTAISDHILAAIIPAGLLATFLVPKLFSR